MSPVVVVLVEELREQSSEVRLVKNNDVIQQFTPAGTNQAFRDSVPPRFLETRSHRGTRIAVSVRTTSAEMIESLSINRYRGNSANGMPRVVVGRLTLMSGERLR